MGEAEKIVAVISPWGNLPKVVRKGFRVQSVPKEKNVLVWRDDLQDAAKLRDELDQLGITPIEIKTRTVTAEWDQP